MAQPQQILALEIVAFAEQVVPDMWPVIVPPVYRLQQDPQRSFVPPFREIDGVLYGATEIDAAEYRRLVAANEITTLPEPIPANIEHELWFDDHGQRHYEPVSRATERLCAIAERELVAASAALEAGNLADAEQHAGIAISADDRLLEPFALRAAIDLHRGETSAIAVQRVLSPTRVSESAFKNLVEMYRATIPDAVYVRRTAIPPQRFSGQRPMCGAAAKKPRVACQR